MYFSPFKVFEAIGEILLEIADNRSDDLEKIRDLCSSFFNNVNLKKSKNDSSTKVLNAPINLNELAAQHTDLEEIKSIWVTSRDDSLKVDAKKLEKAKAKIQQKQEKRNDVKVSYNPPVLQTASASQVVSKKDNKLESKV
jgi:ATP-binding cassette, subfamily F, member 3